MSPSEIFTHIRMEYPGTITTYLGSSTTSELTSPQIIPVVPIHHKQQQLLENVTLPHATRQQIYLKTHFQIKKVVTNIYIFVYIYIRYIRKPTSWCSKLDFLSEFVSNFWELQQKSSYLWDRKAYKQTIHSNSDLASQCWRIKKIKQHHTLAHSPALLLLYFPPHQKVMQIIRTIHVKLQSTHTKV